MAINPNKHDQQSSTEKKKSDCHPDKKEKKEREEKKIEKKIEEKVNRTAGEE